MFVSACQRHADPLLCLHPSHDAVEGPSILSLDILHSWLTTLIPHTDTSTSVGAYLRPGKEPCYIKDDEHVAHGRCAEEHPIRREEGVRSSDGLSREVCLSLSIPLFLCVEGNAGCERKGWWRNGSLAVGRLPRSGSSSSCQLGQDGALARSSTFCAAHILTHLLWGWRLLCLFY